jgi:hypothetical protein
MVHGKTRQDVDPQIRQIASFVGDANRGGSDVLNSTRIFKKTGFRSH